MPAEAPPRYQLVRCKYDGVVIEKGNGEYLVETIKGDDYKQLILPLITLSEVIEYDKLY